MNEHACQRVCELTAKIYSFLHNIGVSCNALDMSHQQNDPVTYALTQIISAELANQGATDSDLARWTGISQPSIWRKLNAGGGIKVGEAVKMLGALGLDFTATMARAERESHDAEGAL